VYDNHHDPEGEQRHDDLEEHQGELPERADQLHHRQIRQKAEIKARIVAKAGPVGRGVIGDTRFQRLERPAGWLVDAL
jgi:hypothetical protein